MTCSGWSKDLPTHTIIQILKKPRKSITEANDIKRIVGTKKICDVCPKGSKDSLPFPRLFCTFQHVSNWASGRWEGIAGSLSVFY